MRIWILTQYYPPEFGAVAVRLSRLARLLVNDGFHITILTGMPNYPTGIIPTEYRKKLMFHEIIEGIDVYRTWVYASPHKGIRFRLLNQISFAFLIALCGTFLKRPDVLLVESHPLFVCLAGIWLRFIKRVPVVLNVSDLWPESAVATGALDANNPLVKLASHVERWAYKSAAHVVAMTMGVRDGIIRVLHQPERVTLIQNAVDLQQFKPGSADHTDSIRQRFNLGSKFVAAHIGNMSLAHDFDLILDAAATLPDITFLFAGGGSQAEHIQRGIEQRNLKNVVLTGVLSHDLMPALWAASDLCLITFKDHPLFSGALPSKMFEAMATGTPIVAAVEGEAERLLSDTGAGITVAPGDRLSLITCLERLSRKPDQLDSMGKAGRAYAESNLDPQRVKHAYLNVFKRVTRI